MRYFYTAVIKDNAVLVENGFTYAEHFEDQEEARKRARQFAMGMSPDDTIYIGTEPPEAFIVRLTSVTSPDHETTEQANTRINALAAKAGAKTVSKLTPPEVDDSAEARPLPEWAKAQHEVEAAGQVVIEAKASVEAHKARHLKAYNANERHAEADARRGLDQAEANLYRAENHLADKVAAYEAKKPKSEVPKEGKKNA